MGVSVTDAVAVRERGILMSGDMVRAILDGTKSQTRRVVKFPAHVSQKNCVPMRWEEQPEAWRLAGQYGGQQLICSRTDDVGVWAIQGPYGEPGDRLWIRETWCPYPKKPIYRADYGAFTPLRDGFGGPWKPSIYMPRRASRLTLEITDVRVQRLQEISQADAKAEGAQIPEIIYPDSPREAYVYAENFRLIWDSLNKKRGHGWDTNPFVWAISFRRIEP